MLDAGCGLGNLAVAAAERGCRVQALDASPAAIEHLQARAAALGLPIDAECADLADFRPYEDRYDSVAAIGLLMFFDETTAWRQLVRLQAAVRPGGVIAINVLASGTTFVDVFAGDAHHLFDAAALRRALAGWTLLLDREDEFEAPRGLRKRFVTIIARRPA